MADIKPIRDLAFIATATEAVSVKKNVSASASLAAVIDAALPANVCGVEVVSHSDNANDIHFNPTGAAATANNSFIEPGGGRVFIGDKATLDKVRLYAAATSAVGIVVFVERRN